MTAPTPRATVAIISIGDMGLGIARLLQAHDYKVITTTAGRSPATHQRALDASITILPTDAHLVDQADYILSIVPPRDALATATRILDAHASLPTPRPASRPPLYYLDLNAISPTTARTIAATITSLAPSIRFLDGAIIGSPPTFNPPTWRTPSIPLSGPHPLPTPHLATTLHTTHLAPDIGPASGLKACYAALTKGFYALALQSYTTAHQLRVLPALQAELGASFPATRAAAERGIVGCPPKAWRWVGEMEEIGATFAGEGGWESEADVFGGGVAEVYRVVAEAEVGMETGGGKRGLGEVVEGVVGTLRGRKEKED